MDHKQIVALVREELKKYDAAFEERLAIAIQRGMDEVLHECQHRLNMLEEDVAALQRHLDL